MAEADFQRPVQNKELKCPICLDFYIDPVQLPCGHNFCLTCIRAVWDCDISEAGPFFCPECQIFLEANLSLEVNTSLQKEVQDFTTRDLDIQEVPPTPLFIPCDHCIGTGSVAVKTCLTCDASLCSAHVELHLKKVAFREHTVIEVTGNPFSFKCSEHREELKLFCQEDGVSVCSLCVVIGSHKDHQVVTSQEACTEMKKLVEDNLTRLVEKRQAAEESMRGLECLFSETASRTADFRESIHEKYSRMKKLIEEDEQLIMNILEAEEMYSLKQLECKKEAVESQIRETEVLMNTSKSLMQEPNTLTFLQHAKAHGLGKDPISPASSWCSMAKDNAESAKFKTVENLVEELSSTISCHLPRMWKYFRNVTFNPYTAHPKLKVSQNKMEVRWSKQPLQHSDNSERFDSQYSVLAENSLTAGRHYWEVLVYDKPYWLIGIAYASMPRKGGKNLNFTNLGMNKVSWCVYHSNGQYLACHDSQETVLSVQGKLDKLGVWVDIDNQVLSFYNADTLTQLHSFSVQYLEEVYPVFNPCIDVNEKNCQPFTLFHL